MMMDGTVSITVPTTSRRRLASSRNTQGLAVIPVKDLASASGMPCRAKIHPYAVEVAMRNITMPVPTPVFTRISGRCDQRSSRYTSPPSTRL